MAGTELSRRVEKVVGYPPLCEMSDQQRREFHEALLDADTFEDLPGKWQAAILEAEESRPKLRIVGGDCVFPQAGRGCSNFEPSAGQHRTALLPAHVHFAAQTEAAGTRWLSL
jgi:hypothetical protein